MGIYFDFTCPVLLFVQAKNFSFPRLNKSFIYKNIDVFIYVLYLWEFSDNPSGGEAVIISSLLKECNSVAVDRKMW
ncbi:hypothetical protein NT017_23020 [Prolixibacter sp. NT017]|nr:hypothetical protein NT017_23020 [Prolixibacter sp. NT017]